MNKYVIYDQNSLPTAGTQVTLWPCCTFDTLAEALNECSVRQHIWKVTAQGSHWIAKQQIM